jgi:Calcineurin-like phosphoesterase
VDDPITASPTSPGSRSLEDVAGSPAVPGRGAARALLIGDVAGHLDALRWALAAHEVDLATATLPDGLVVVQVGDLVHRGPDSAGVIALVDRFLRGPHAERWIQLIGNHEQPYLFDQPSVIRRELDERSVETLRAWWADGLARAAAAITPDWAQVALPRRVRSVHSAGDILVTHAGLTHGAWLALGQPATAAAAAAAINADAHGSAALTLREGRMTTGITDLAAGPLWAQAGAELLASWDRTADAPHLNQIHGHATTRAWSQERWWPGADAIINRGDVHPDHIARRELARIGNRLIWGIDPGHEHTPAPQWQPLVIPLEGDHPIPRVHRRAARHLFRGSS